MTTSQQIELLQKVSESVDQHEELYGLFKDIVTDSPIEGTREETIKAEYKTLGDNLESLYMEVIHAIAAWLVEQP